MAKGRGFGWHHSEETKRKMRAAARRNKTWLRPERTSTLTAERRFWAKVNKSSGRFCKVTGTECWEWTGAKADTGYGQLGMSRKAGRVYAHRFAFELHGGVVLDGMELLHSCDWRACVNWDHLSVGTHGDNMADAARKGRMPSGENHWRAKGLSKNENNRKARARYRRSKQA